MFISATGKKATAVGFRRSSKKILRVPALLCPRDDPNSEVIDHPLLANKATVAYASLGIRVTCVSIVCRRKWHSMITMDLL